MNDPDQTPSVADDAGTQAASAPVEQAPPEPIVVRRKTLILWLGAAALAGSLVAATATLLTAQFHARKAISALEKTIERLAEEKRSALQQLEELRNSHYAQVIAERRCEVIDGLEDCLKAGLKRPPRFAETDRQYLEARRAAGSKTGKPASAANASAATSVGGAQGSPAPHAAGKMSLDEFARTLGKIPGIAIDGSAADRPERKAEPSKAAGNPGKPGSE